MLVAIQDDGSNKMNENAYKALEKIGARNQLRNVFRSSFSMIGWTGNGIFNEFEVIQVLYLYVRNLGLFI